ncbi:MAG: flavoprotein [Mycoplasma sp.]
MKKILIIVSGGVALVKTPTLIQLLKTRYEIRVITTDCVKNNYKNYSSLNSIKEISNLESYPQLHIENAKWADLILVVPVTAKKLELAKLICKELN